MSIEIIKLAENFLKVTQELPQVRYAGDPVLRTPTTEISIKEGIEIGKILGELTLKYRSITGYGRGFAAPQIGINKSVYVTYVDDELQTFINPVVVEQSNQTNFYRELCLSSGILSADVERSENIVLIFNNESGKRVTERFEGFLARLHQHEEKHLRGILNLDEAATGGIELATFDPLLEKLRTRR